MENPPKKGMPRSRKISKQGSTPTPWAQGLRDQIPETATAFSSCTSAVLGCTPKGAYGNTAFWEAFWEGSGKGSGEGVLRRVLRRGFSMSFTVKKGSEKGSQKGFWEGGVSRRCLEHPLVEYAPLLGVRPMCVVLFLHGWQGSWGQQIQEFAREGAMKEVLEVVVFPPGRAVLQNHGKTTTQLFPGHGNTTTPPRTRVKWVPFVLLALFENFPLFYSIFGFKIGHFPFKT